MAVITFSKPVAFPVAPLREMLSRYVPLYRWQCGEDDSGGEREMGVFRDTGLISGRSDSSVVLVEYRAQLAQFPGAPAHEWYLELFEPTTELKPVADRITAVICAVVMILDEHDAHCRLVPDGPWLGAGAMPGVLRALTEGKTLAEAVAAADDGAAPAPAGTLRPASAAPPVPPAPRADIETAMAGKRVFPHLTVLLDRPLRCEGEVLAGFARDLDPDGGWTFRRSDGGQGMLLGRGALIGILDIPEPLPDGMLADGWTRSFWFEGDRALVERHSSHLCISTTLDTAAAEWETVRQVAKVMTLAAAWTARLPGAVALHNTGPGITFEASRASNFLAILGRDQLPVMLWSWTKPHDMTDGNVCLSTSGLVPFLGHELEVWNAPLPCAEVAAKLSDIIIYLLDAGPVIGHGDTAGRTSGDRSIRCFLGASRAERPDPVQALFLEFDEPEGAAPKPDLPEAPPPAAPEALRPAGHRALLLIHTGIGLPARDMVEQFGLAFPERRWSISASDRGLNEPRVVTGTGPGGPIVARIVAHPGPCAEPGIPDHAGHVEVMITAPDPDDAEFVAAMVLGCLVLGQDPQARGRLAPGGPWHDYDDLCNRMVAVKHQRRAPPPPAAAGLVRRAGGFGRRGL